MSDSAQPESTPETTNAPSPTAPPTGAASWVAPSHSQFAGRSAEEILGIAEMAASQLARFNQQPQVPQEQPRNRFDLDLPDDEYLTGRQVKGILSQFANQPAPVDTHARNLAAQGLYGTLKSNRADEFRRWEREINAEIGKLDVSYWTYDALNTIVNMVRANHVDELVAEKAQRLANESHPTIRSGTGGSAGGSHTQTLSLESDRVPKDMVARARAVGIDDATLAEVCRDTGITPDQYLQELERYGKGAVIRG